MKKLSLPAVLFFCHITSSLPAQNICTQQFSNFTVQGNDSGITSADAAAIVADILDVMGLKGNFEIKAANIPNAAAVVYNGKRYVLYNPVFISKLNHATGNDWASVSVLAHEIGHHLNGHTLSGGSQPARELEADEFSGYVMQRLGASFEEAATAMKLAADVKGTATHPGRTDRIMAIEQGWNRASDQLAADIEANEGDSIAETQVQSVKAVNTGTADSDSVTGKNNAALLAKEDILAYIFFEADKTGTYYVTNDGRLLTVKDKRLLQTGTLKPYNHAKYPYIIQMNNDLLYIDGNGLIADHNGLVTGRLKVKG